MKLGTAIIIFFVAIIALIPELILYFIFGIGAAFSGESSAIGGIAAFFVSLFIFTIATAVLAPICAIIQLIVTKFVDIKKEKNQKHNKIVELFYKDVGSFLLITILGILLLFLVLFVGFATSVTSEDFPSTEEYNSLTNSETSANSDGNLKSPTLSVKIVEKRTFIQVGQSFGDSLLGKKAQGKFLVLTLEIENTGKEPIYVSTNDIRLFDNEGRKYIPDTEAMLYYQDSFVFESINPGIKSRGAVIFDVPDPNKEFKLEVSNNVLSLFD